ncbi:MAG TPA: hypothetical protein VEF76_09390 [Patescibacteria group bacterium]|nr:hypothetical protein [Patescibacteria group bacterium]
MSHVTATFSSRPAAENALIKLVDMGIREEQLSLIVTEESRGNHFQIEQHSRADEGAAAGATFGGVVGAIIGSVLAAGTLAIPGLNLIVVGSLAGGLAGLGAGAASGGLIGALVGAGMTEHEAKIYENELKAGNILLAVKPVDRDQKNRIEEALRKTEAFNIASAA